MQILGLLPVILSTKSAVPASLTEISQYELSAFSMKPYSSGEIVSSGQGPILGA